MNESPQTSRAPSRQGVVICTLDRPDDLRRTLESIAAQDVEARPDEVVVVDASGEEARARTADWLADFTALRVRHVPYDDAPSSSRQRNVGLRHLDPGIQIVHFMDDDVTLQPGYFAYLADVLRMHPEVGGVAPRVIVDREAPPAGRADAWRYLFLLDHPRPGKALPSGEVSGSQARVLEAGAFVDAFGGCCAYRRSLLEAHRFDERLEGYAIDEDLDLSFRIGRASALYVEPRAVLVHHVSPRNRYAARRYAREYLVARYWFLEKHIAHPLRKPAFWWSTVGRILGAWLARAPQAEEKARGYLEATRLIWRRDHALLRRKANVEN